MFQIEYQEKFYHLPTSITESDDILDHIYSFFQYKKQKIILSYNNIILSPKVNYNLLEIGYSPNEVIKAMKSVEKKVYFFIVHLNYTYSMKKDQYGTVFEAKKYFAEQFYTVPENIVIKYKDKYLPDSDQIIQYFTNKDTAFQVSVKEEYFLVRTYLNKHHFVCLKLNSTVENLKETVSMYSQNDDSIEFQCVYSDNLKEICEQNNIEVESEIDTKNIQELSSFVPVFEFAKSTKYSNKKFTITAQIKDYKFNKEITKNYNSTERISLYSLTVLLERDLGIDRSLFVPINQDGTKMKLTEFASPNKKNFVFKLFHSLNVKINAKFQKISYLTTIKDIQKKYKFKEHNFGIIINNHYVYEKKEDKKYLIVHFMNKSKEPTVIDIHKSLEPSHLITYTKVEPTNTIKALFLIPKKMSKYKIAITYLHHDENPIEIIEENKKEILYQNLKTHVIDLVLKTPKSIIYKYLEISGNNIRIIDVFNQIYKNMTNIFDDSKKLNAFIAKYDDQIIHLWDSITNIYTDKYTRIHVDLLKRKKVFILNLYNNSKVSEITFKERETSAIIIKNYCQQKGITSAENLYLYADFNKLRKNDIPSLFNPEYDFLVLNQEKDTKKLKIQNLSELKIEYEISKYNYSNCAEIIRDMFQLSKIDSKFFCIINNGKYHLPPKFDAGALPDDCKIEIRYDYQKENQIQFRYQHNEEKILKVDVDQPIESIIPVIQEEFKLWHLSRSAIYFSFYSFDFPPSKSISYYQIPENATIEIRENKKAFPIQISTPENCSFNNYYFVRDETIADVIDHLQAQFKSKFTVYEDSKATKKMKIDTKLKENMKLYVVSEQKTIKCKGSIGEDEIKVCEILTVKEASNYISMKLKSKVYIFTKNEEDKSYESAEEDKRLSEYKEQLYAHKYFQTIDFNYVIFTKNEHISELNTINWLREKYISKVLLINMNDFIIKKNKKRLNETDTIGQVLENFTGKLNIYIEDKIQESQPSRRPVSVRKYKPCTTNIILSSSTNSHEKDSLNKKKCDIDDKEKCDKKKNIKNKQETNKEDEYEERSSKNKNTKMKYEKSDENKDKISKFNEKKTKRLSIKKHKPVTTNVNRNDDDDDDEYSIKSFSSQNNQREEDKKETSDGDKDDEKSDSSKETSDSDKDDEKSDSSKEKGENKEFDLIILDLNKYELHKNRIGRGSYGEVFKIKDKKTGEIYAAKILFNPISDTNNIEKRNIYRELNIMAKISHPNIVKFIGFSPVNFHGENKPVILTELAPNGSLADLLKKERKGMSPTYWDDTHKLIAIYSIASAMSFLHSHDIIHRDLKPANILMIEINGKFYLKVADFGLSKMINSPEQNSLSIYDSSVIMGTPAYMAPEMMKDSKSTKAGDVYAFGIIVYEIITGEIPFDGLSLFQMAAKVTNGIRPEFKKVTPEFLKKFIKSCWNQEPDNRPSFEDIVKDLKENKEFITENVDENEYYNCIDYIEHHQTKYDETRKISSHYIQKKIKTY